MLPKKRVTTHPGEVLQVEFLEPLGISQSELARHIGVMPYVVCELVRGKRGVSPRMAFMLSRALGTSPEFWIGLQTDHDLSKLMQTRAGKRVRDISPMVQPRNVL
jgi:addiction module HigA family antidote